MLRLKQEVLIGSYIHSTILSAAVRKLRLEKLYNCCEGHEQCVEKDRTFAFLGEEHRVGWNRGRVALKAAASLPGRIGE